jgi:nicotinamidase-related amidase
MNPKNFYEEAYKSSPLEIETTPCLFVVDFQLGAFVYNLDEMAKEAVPHCIRLLRLFRTNGLPIVHFWLDEEKWFQRNPRRRAYEDPLISPNEIHPSFQPIERELVIEKPDRSCFFRTDVETFLRKHQIQNIVLAGTTTSGCIRSTVTHGDMIGYTMILPEECIWDQSKVVHEANMFDMKYKYAEVWSINEVERKVNKFLLSENMTKILSQTPPSKL